VTAGRPDLPGPAQRRAELASSLHAVRARIAGACAQVGRDPAEVTLIAVTKTWPASDVTHLAALGVTDFGENRDAEAAEKAASVGRGGLRWHFVGQVQTNKARSVAAYADVVHSVDRSRLVRALATGAAEAGRTLGVLLQVDLDPSGGGAARGGAAPSAVAELAAEVAGTASLELLGVMAVAPLGVPPEPAFARLAAISAALRSSYPAAAWISSGMSADLDAAVRTGATHVRVGSSLLGTRPPGR
jgi:pyridoxal phosphate enzyme (YggS family)